MLPGDAAGNPTARLSNIAAYGPRGHLQLLCHDCHRTLTKTSFLLALRIFLDSPIFDKIRFDCTDGEQCLQRFQPATALAMRRYK